MTNGRRRWPRKRGGWPPNWRGRPWRGATTQSPWSCWPIGWRTGRYRHERRTAEPVHATATGPHVAGMAARAGDERLDWNVRARRAGVTAYRERVLHRRHGTPPDRDRPRTGPRP